MDTKTNIIKIKRKIRFITILNILFFSVAIIIGYLFEDKFKELDGLTSIGIMYGIISLFTFLLEFLISKKRSIKSQKIFLVVAEFVQIVFYGLSLSQLLIQLKRNPLMTIILIIITLSTAIIKLIMIIYALIFPVSVEFKKLEKEKKANEKIRIKAEHIAYKLERENKKKIEKEKLEGEKMEHKNQNILRNLEIKEQKEMLKIKQKDELNEKNKTKYEKKQRKKDRYVRFNEILVYAILSIVIFYFFTFYLKEMSNYFVQNVPPRGIFVGPYYIIGIVNIIAIIFLIVFKKVNSRILIFKILRTVNIFLFISLFTLSTNNNFLLQIIPSLPVRNAINYVLSILWGINIIILIINTAKKNHKFTILSSILSASIIIISSLFCFPGLIMKRNFIFTSFFTFVWPLVIAYAYYSLVISMKIILYPVSIRELEIEQNRINKQKESAENKNYYSDEFKNSEIGKLNYELDQAVKAQDFDKAKEIKIKIDEYKATHPVEIKSYFDGWLFQLVGWNILCFFANLLTLGILYPFTICWKLKWKYKHTVYDGKRLVFDGNGIQLFGKWLLWMLLCIVTLFIYAIFIPIRIEKWKASHTHLVDDYK